MKERGLGLGYTVKYCWRFSVLYRDFGSASFTSFSFPAEHGWHFFLGLSTRTTKSMGVGRIGVWLSIMSFLLHV